MTDFNDSLERLFAGDTGPVRSEPVRVSVPSYKSAETRFVEGCPKCKGSGKFVSWGGRTLGDCFACKGKGNRSYKTSSETREANREKSAMKKAEAIAEDFVAFRAAHPAVMQWLDIETSKAKPFEFAVAMIQALANYGSLTERQLETCERLAAKAAERIAERASAVANAPQLDVSAIEKAFATARERAFVEGQRGVMVKPLMLSAGPLKTDIAFKCSPGSIGSQWEGQIFFKSADGERKLGYVKDGRFVRQFACTDAEQDAVLKVASDPKAGLFAYAKAWSRCGVCSRQLLKKESIERGIGPICLAKYGF